MSASQLNAFTPKLFTILKEGYKPGDFKADFLAGLTVAIVALPLAMALAIASGTSPEKGLVTAVIAGFLISFLGGSRVQIGGPTGAFVVVVFNVIAHHGYDGLVLATLIAGFILVVCGYAKFGQVIKFIPYPVITGFTAGIAVIIASSQVKDFLGLRMEQVPADFLPKWGAYFGHLNTTDLMTLAVGVGSLAVILALRRYAPRWPGYLIAVIIAAVVAAVFHLPVETIGSRFPDIPTGLPMPEFPDFTFEKFHEVLPAAFTIAFLAGIEALLSAMVADGMTGFRHRSNQELVGQGVANIASALFGGLPATGAIARTATNIKAGGKSPVSGIIHAIFLLLFMLVAMDIVAFIPMAALAAILFVVAWGMSEIHHFIHIYKLSKPDRVVLLLTFFLTVLIDLTVAIGVGVGLAAVFFMIQMSKSIELEYRVFDEEDQRTILPEGVEVFRITGPVFFGVSSDLLDTLKRMGQMPKSLIVRLEMVPYLDASGASALERFVSICRQSGTNVILSGLKPQPMGILKKSHIGHKGYEAVFADSYAAAVAMSLQAKESA